MALILTVTIRKTLLIAFLCVSLGPSILLASLAFVKARAAIQAEIERNLAIQAASVAADVDKMMFERLQNGATWSRLDAMQDLQIHDLDQRLSHFLGGLQTGYHDVYLNLSGTDVYGRVISSSDIHLLGHALPSPSPWATITLSGVTMELERPTQHPLPGLMVRVPVSSAFTGNPLGSLRLQLDWARIYAVLDQASGSDGRMVVLLDRRGRVIAASEPLRSRGLLLSTALANWRESGNTVINRSGQPLSSSAVMVGASPSHGYANFSGLGWTTLVIQPVDQALEPMHRMAYIFLALIGIIIIFTLLISTWVSREIARPIVALTGFTRSYMRNKVLPAPTTKVGGEVAELTDAFVQMVGDIDRSQQHLVRASKLAVAGEMSSIIAHEVRTPLGILRSSAQMLQREPGISAEGHELAGFIASETERLNGLVSAMLNIAKPRPPAYATVNMHELIRKSIAMLTAQAQKKHISVAAKLLAVHPVLECDEEQMTQVLLNLLMNALQILQANGRLEVETRNQGRDLLIEIADDGPGINAEDRSRIFEAFFSRRDGGIGLGLAIVQQIVLAHGGDITVAESRWHGAQFRIRLSSGNPE